MDVEPPLQIIGWDFVLLHLLGSVELFLGSRALTEVVQLAALCRSSSLIAQMEYQKISEEQGIVGLPSGQEIGILSNIHRLDFVSLDRLRARFYSCLYFDMWVEWVFLQTGQVLPTAHHCIIAQTPHRMNLRWRFSSWLVTPSDWSDSESDVSSDDGDEDLSIDAAIHKIIDAEIREILSDERLERLRRKCRRLGHDLLVWGESS